MINTYYDLSRYTKLFSSPVPSTSVLPITNFQFSAISSREYANSFGKKAQSTTAMYLKSLTASTKDLKTSSKNLSSNDVKSTFNKKDVFSSSSSIIGKASYNASEKSYTLNVSKVASSQENKGASLKNSDKTFTTGSNSISIKSKNSEKAITFNVTSDDTNISSLNKMAKSINDSNSGVSASVITDSKTETSYLKINSSSTGTDNSFTITDTSGTAVQTSNSSNIEKQAENAQYKLDGKDYTSQSNNINIDFGKVSLNLLKADGKDIKITVDKGLNSIKEDIKSFITDFNEVQDVTKTYSSTINGSKKLNTELAAIFKNGNAERAGITVTSDGKLALNEEKLTNALENNFSDVKNIFSNNGLADKTLIKSSEVLTSPSKYLNNALSYLQFNKDNNPFAGLLLDQYI